MDKRARTLKGMTIAENLIAFVLILTALTISGTGFYTAGSFINKGRMYEEAADRAQVMMETGMFEKVVAAFGENVSEGNNKYDSPQLRSRMKELGYELYGGYYVDTDTMIAVKPCSSADGWLTDSYNDPDCIAASERLYSSKNGNVYDLDESLEKLPGIYLYICVPVDAEQVRELTEKGYPTEEAIGVSDYVPLVRYAGQWRYE